MPASTSPTSLPWAAIRLLATDVDGVLTDGTFHLSGDGTETKVFHVHDGLGMVKLLQNNISVAWISGRPSRSTTVRATELKILHVIQGRSDKHVALAELAASLNLTAAECCYLGDDEIDVGALRWAAIGVAPADAMPVALAAADYVTTRAGGRGAVREVCEHILAARGLTSS